MKKILSAILVLCLLLSCCGCSMIIAIRGDNEERSRYLKMTTQELEALSDEELLHALYIRTGEAADISWNLGNGAAALPEAQKVFYVVYCFQAEQENGGLCRFFVNSSRNLAPLVSQCLSGLGAQEHQELFDKFVKDNELSLDSLNYFIINKESQFEEKRAYHPFDDYDVPYGQLPSLRDMLISYAREHIGDF